MVEKMILSKIAPIEDNYNPYVWIGLHICYKQEFEQLFFQILENDFLKITFSFHMVKYKLRTPHFLYKYKKIMVKTSYVCHIQLYIQ